VAAIFNVASTSACEIACITHLYLDSLRHTTVHPTSEHAERESALPRGYQGTKANRVRRRGLTAALLLRSLPVAAQARPTSAVWAVLWQSG